MDPTALSSVLAVGAAMALPVKASVDAVKRAVDLPAWASLVLAFAFGQAFVWLVAVYTGDPLDAQHIAGFVLAGLGATGAAVATTELHKAAREDLPTPEQQAVLVAAAIERRLREKPAEPGG